MKFAEDERSRQVVPRWRSFGTARDLGELEHHLAKNITGESEGLIRDLLDDWKENPIVAVASDLVSGAITVNSDRALDAAEFLFASDQVGQLEKRVAKAYLDDFRKQESVPERAEAGEEAKTLPASTPSFDTRHLFISDIRKTRRKLSAYPRNPMLWCNLARSYVTLGLDEKARRSMSVALDLSPYNRFVIRSASRMHLHLRDRKKAHRVVAEAKNLKADPWLLASEIATSAVLGKNSYQIKHARKMLERGDLRPFHLSELASAIGTIEIESGRHNPGKLLIEQSMAQPAENATAQAAWLDRREGKSVSADSLEALSAEANAWNARLKADWNLAIAEFQNWQAMESFASRPAIFGSMIAANAMGDYTLSAEISKNAILGNPDDATLYNNLAWAHALDDKVGEAIKAYKLAFRCKISDRAKVVLKATGGLIAFRQGDLLLGRTLYLTALQDVKRISDPYLESYAKLCHAREEIRAGTSDRDFYRKKALDASNNLTDPIFKPWLDEIRSIPLPTEIPSEFKS